MKRLLNYFSNRFLPRWLVLIFDLSILPIAYFLGYLLRFNFELPAVLNQTSGLHFALIFPVFLFCFYKSKTYSGILRHSTSQDVMRIISSMLYGGVLLLLFSFAARNFGIVPKFILPYSVIIIMVLLASTLLVLSRLLAKAFYYEYFSGNLSDRKIMIFGAGQLGHITRNALLLDSSSNIKLIGFIDDNPSLQNKISAGTPIYSVTKAFNKIIPQKEVTELIIAVGSSEITRKRKRQITDKCLKHKIEVKEVPPVTSWIKGELKAQAIKRIKIEDLLGRDAIQLSQERIEEELKNSVVLVTGAAGSIGSEIVRQLIGFNVKHVILLDKAESELFNLQHEILSNKPVSKFNVIVGDITNEATLRKIFTKYAPTVIFNAAAYKHVPLMEEFPCEALRVNIGGTKILADLSIEYGVKKFVFISTDKAVNPTNVMGVSKRISEIYIQSLAQSKNVSTKFITTRFGNVLGSNGSVVPLFKKQIEKGGPVTVTHKDITRYFMTIPEACQLVLEAGFMGKGGEIFVFDMGEPIRIYDLAKKMISLSGFVPNHDIDIKITNLRPGEKLYEELLDGKEKLIPTHNDKILIGKVRKHHYNAVNKKITTLLDGVDTKSHCALVEEMMDIVPEFIPVNSFFFVKKKPLETAVKQKKVTA